MRDWAIAILIGVLVAVGVVILPPLMALIGIVLFPALILCIAILLAWFLLQVIKDRPNGGHDRDGS